MGNGADFFSRDAQGRRSEYVSLGKAESVNGVKGHLIKKKGDTDRNDFPLFTEDFARVDGKGNRSRRIGQLLYGGEHKPGVI